MASIEVFYLGPLDTFQHVEDSCLFFFQSVAFPSDVYICSLLTHAHTDKRLLPVWNMIIKCSSPTVCLGTACTSSVNLVVKKGNLVMKKYARALQRYFAINYRHKREKRANKSEWRLYGKERSYFFDMSALAKNSVFGPLIPRGVNAVVSMHHFPLRLSCAMGEWQTRNGSRLAEIFLQHMKDHTWLFKCVPGSDTFTCCGETISLSQNRQVSLLMHRCLLHLTSLQSESPSSSKILRHQKCPV